MLFGARGVSGADHSRIPQGVNVALRRAELLRHVHLRQARGTPGMLDGFKVNREIQALVSAQNAPEAEKRQALATLRQLTVRAVPQLIDGHAVPAPLTRKVGLHATESFLPNS